ncbi:MAG: response regulator [Gaiellaceae bacterium]
MLHHSPDGDYLRPLTCVVADDHPALVSATVLLLEEQGIDVVAFAGDGVAALTAIEKHRPSVALLDVMMPLLTGIEVATQVRERAPETATVLYTGFSEGQLLTEALEAGARGFVLKDAPLNDVVRAVTHAARGESYVDPGLASALLRVHASPVGAAHGLSSGERDILHLLADGRSNGEIAVALSLSPETVRTYVRRAMLKLAADTRTQAVAIALRRSIII